MNADTFERPFPALTATERVHLEIYGYVVVPNTLTTSEVSALSTRIKEIEGHYRKTGKLPGKAASSTSLSPEYFRIDNLPHVDRCFLDYLTHPRLVGMAEEAIGGEARLEQSDAHVRRPDKSKLTYGFHRGLSPTMAMIENGLYHFPFVKTLTNLTDLGPDDGGTVVIAGSHKLGGVSIEACIQASEADPSLVHQVIAPAGSTLLFFESLIHGSGIIKSDKERILIIGGYAPPAYQAWHGYDPDPDFLNEVDPKFRPLLEGTNRWLWKRNFRKL